MQVKVDPVIRPTTWASACAGRFFCSLLHKPFRSSFDCVPAGAQHGQKWVSLFGNLSTDFIAYETGQVECPRMWSHHKSTTKCSRWLLPVSVPTPRLIAALNHRY
jgi:hypothetical protein